MTIAIAYKTFGAPFFGMRAAVVLARATERMLPTL